MIDRKPCKGKQCEKMLDGRTRLLGVEQVVDANKVRRDRDGWSVMIIDTRELGVEQVVDVNKASRDRDGWRVMITNTRELGVEQVTDANKVRRDRDGWRVIDHQHQRAWSRTSGRC